MSKADIEVHTELIARAMQPIYDKISKLDQLTGYLKYRLDTLHEIEFNRLFQNEYEKLENAGQLWRHGYRVFSQNQEDGMIAEIFKRIGVTNRTFVEIGTGDGTECNTAKLLVEGWTGLWLESDPECIKYIKEMVELHFNRRLLSKEALVTAENINQLLIDTKDLGEIDLLSIDVDYNDYWLWKALTVIKPRVVVIEYNALWPPPLSLVVPYNPKAVWDGTNYRSASLEAMTRMAADKGYSLVGCDFTGLNAFYVRNDLVGDKFLQPYTAERHYVPARYYLHRSPIHPNRLAPYLKVASST